MVYSVEGEWKTFTFRMISQKDFPQISEHLRSNFYLDEVLCKAVGNSEAFFGDFDKLASEMINDNISFAAFDTATGQLAAVRITYRYKKSDHDSASDLESEEIKTLLGFLTSVNGAANIFEKYQVEEIADFFVASVEREYRSQGLASEMYRRSLLLLKDLGVPVVKSAFTSALTRIAVSKLGFKELSRKHVRELQNLNGVFLCPDAGDDEFVAVMALKL